MNKQASLQSRFIPFVLFLILLGAAAGRSHAAPLLETWYVDAATGSDSNDCLSAASACQSVAEAVSRAGGGDTIQIAAGLYSENLELGVPLTLSGAGAGSTILDGGGSGRVLVTTSTITVQNLTVQGGHISGGNGGGIFNLAALTLQNVHVVDNTATGGGAGIYNSGTLTMTGSQVSGNSADEVGGGIFTWYGSSTEISNSVIDGNSGDHGGGIYNLGTLEASHSTISGNSAVNYSGGGIINFGGTITLESVTVSGNQSVANGGGINNQFGVINLINTTISGNTAYQYGGLANDLDTAETTLLNSTVAYNTATGAGVQVGGIGNNGSISFQNSIVAQNGVRNCAVGGSWTSLGHNLADDAHCDFNSSGDLESTPAGLASLATYNNSATQMHALLPGSAAIDAGDNSACPPQDQRSQSRPLDGDGDGTAVCDIGAFEARSQITTGDVTLTEGDSGTSQAVFTVSLFPPVPQAVNVTYETVDGTAEAGSDYVSKAGTLTFVPGQDEQTVAVEIVGDTDDEPDESFSLHLSGALLADIIISDGTATIIDDDGLPALTVADVTVSEGDSATTTAQFTVTLSPAATTPVTVDAATSNGTAEAGSDYTAAAQSLTFAPGQTSRQVEILIHGDIIDEGASESFYLNLTNAAGATVAVGTGTATILDNDTARLSLEIGPTVYEGHSGTREALFTVTLNRPAAFPVTVDYETADSVSGNPATAGVDYEPTSGTLTLAPGVTSQNIAVTIYGDSDDEPDETFQLYLSNAAPVPLSGNVSTATILNDEGVFLLYLPVLIRP